MARSSIALLGATLLAFQTASVGAVVLNACSSINNAASQQPIAQDTWMTATNCRGNCTAYSTNQFSVVQGTKCWCTNYFASSTVDISKCLTICPGWPAEYCAGSGYFGYIANNALDSAAVSNALAVGGTTQRTSSSVQQSRTQVSTQEIQSSVPPSTVPVTSVVVSVSPSPVTIPASSSSSSTPPPPSTTPSSSSSSSSIEPVTSTQLVTVSGAVVTQFITSTPTAPATMASSVGDGSLPRPSTRHGLSGGAIAGIAVGAAIGGLLLAAFLFFCCYRRRGTDEEGGMRRQPSLLSKAGLLRGDSTAMSPAKRRGPPTLQTTGLGTFSGPASAASNAAPLAMTESRTSRPMITDSRLNPNAIMTHQNASRSSVGTLQDNQDYSRPLEVRNPDP